MPPHIVFVSGGQDDDEPLLDPGPLCQADKPMTIEWVIGVQLTVVRQAGLSVWRPWPGVRRRIEPVRRSLEARRALAMRRYTYVSWMKQAAR